MSRASVRSRGGSVGRPSAGFGNVHTCPGRKCRGFFTLRNFHPQCSEFQNAAGSAALRHLRLCALGFHSNFIMSFLVKMMRAMPGPRPSLL